jgi:hypothetical protein
MFSKINKLNQIETTNQICFERKKIRIISSNPSFKTKKFLDKFNYFAIFVSCLK